MEQDNLNIPKLLLVFLVYMGLSILGCFTGIEAILFPIFALPFALYIQAERPPVIEQGIFHLVIIGFNYYLSDYHIMSVIAYSIGVILMSFMLNFYYDKELTLPHFITYVSISVCVIVLIFCMIAKIMGIDFEKIYIASINSIKSAFEQATTLILNMGIENNIGSDKIELLKQNQKHLSIVLEQMKMFYAYMIVTVVVSFSSITVVIYNALLRKKNKQLPSIKQLLEFRLSKVAVLIFAVATMIVSGTDASQKVIMVLGLNLMNVFIWLFKTVGGLGLIGLVNRSTAHTGLKMLGYIGVILSFGIFPYMLMIFGCLDAFFNYRKVDIVV